MIEVRLGELAEAREPAILRPVASDWSAVTAAARRVELAAGPGVVAWCQRMGEVPVGSAVISPAGGLAAEYLIHVSVRSDEYPVTREVVRRGLVNGIRRMREWGIERVALPPLGVGAGNLDAEESADTMIPVLVEELGAMPGTSAVIVVESDYEYEVFERVLGAVRSRDVR